MALYRTTAKKTMTTASSPAVGNDISEGYEVGSVWTNSATKQAFKLQDNSIGAAVWKLDADLSSELQAVYAAGVDRTTNSPAATFTPYANSKTIAADSLIAGDVIKFRQKNLMVARNGTDVHDVALYMGTPAAMGLQVVNTGDQALVAGDYVIFEGSVTVCDIGAGGHVNIDVLVKQMVGGVPSESRLIAFDSLIDTTAAMDLMGAVDPDAQSAGNQIDQRELECWVERAGTVA